MCGDGNIGDTKKRFTTIPVTFDAIEVLRSHLCQVESTRLISARQRSQRTPKRNNSPRSCSLASPESPSAPSEVSKERNTIKPRTLRKLTKAIHNLQNKEIRKL